MRDGTLLIIVCMIKRALRLGLFQVRGMFRSSFFYRPPTISYEEEPLAERIGLF